jgi:hypothetical protein
MTSIGDRDRRERRRRPLVAAGAIGVRSSLALGLALLAGACGLAPDSTVQTVETLYQDVRAWKDELDVTRARGASRTTRGVPLTEVVARYNERLARLRDALATVRTAPPSGEDRRALDVMRRTVEETLDEDESPSPEGDQPGASVDCVYDPRRLAGDADGLKLLSDRIYACFGRAAATLSVEGTALDRLTILSLLAVTDDAERRKRLFLALDPVWRSINGDGSPASSPYRHLVRLSAAALAAGQNSVEARAAELGIEPKLVEGWLTDALDAWRRIAPDATLEPWDFLYRTGKASRVLGPAVPRDALRAINARYYRDLGADLAVLGVQYDLDPRPGKNPVAFTAFGARPRLADGAWLPGEPWVFASYRIGGINNLGELLHETGHAVHAAALRARPAFADWPDSDVFTEALADVPALELFEPAWQRRYLGVAAPLGDAIRAKYAGIVLDTAWALFELRMHRDPAADPNRVWTEITERHLRVRPHPEWAWWAVRGQLVSASGYMLSYALGAIVAADLRARVKTLRGPFTEGDPGWYGWMSSRLYRFGLERPSRRVLEDFLGRPVSPRAFLDDLARAARGDAGHTRAVAALDDQRLDSLRRR